MPSLSDYTLTDKYRTNYPFPRPLPPEAIIATKRPGSPATLWQVATTYNGKPYGQKLTDLSGLINAEANKTALPIAGHPPEHTQFYRIH